jgi:hypothetical protein
MASDHLGARVRELLEARDALRRQIDMLEQGPLHPQPGEFEYMRTQAAHLRGMLKEIEEEIDAS